MEVVIVAVVAFGLGMANGLGMGWLLHLVVDRVLGPTVDVRPIERELE